MSAKLAGTLLIASEDGLLLQRTEIGLNLGSKIQFLFTTRPCYSLSMLLLFRWN